MAKLTKFEKATTAIEKIANSAKVTRGYDRCQEVTLHTGYSEPGYSDGPVATGNWNDITRWVDGKSEHVDDAPSRLATKLEAIGFELEWSDEWINCGQCGGLVRCSGDSYSWVPSYTEVDGEIECSDCALENPESLLESYEGNPSKAVTLDINPQAHGYVRLNDNPYEHGLHNGQDADPKAIAAVLDKLGVERYLFTLDESSQFYSTFSVWAHDENGKELLDHATHALQSPESYNGPSPSKAMQSALQDATAQMGSLPDGEGVKYASLQADGTAKVRLVSPQEFVEGIKHED